MELSVAALEGLGHALDGVDDAEALNEIHIDARRIADQTQHGLVLALGDMHAKSLIFEPVDELLALVCFRAMLEYDDHDSVLLRSVMNFYLRNEKCGTGLTCAASSHLFQEPFFVASQISLTMNSQ